MLGSHPYDPLPWHPPLVAKAGSAGLYCLPAFVEVRATAQVAGVQICSLSTPVAGEIEGSPLDQYPHPHVNLLVRCLERQTDHHKHRGNLWN